MNSFRKLAAKFGLLESTPVGNMPDDTFILYRIIGNDLSPRHKHGQSLENVKFILDNEPELTNCKKRWVINRIVDKAAEEKIIELLREHGQQYLHIPFDPEVYSEIGLDTSFVESADYFSSKDYLLKPLHYKRRMEAALLRRKNAYIMNNNGARNFALNNGRGKADWILPWDGNCFLKTRAWEAIRYCISTNKQAQYVAVPMHRLWQNSEILSWWFRAKPKDEPQIAFRSDSVEKFNPEFVYGARSKVELLWRLGIPGPWDEWGDGPWDGARPEAVVSGDKVVVGGWVARLFSGNKNQEINPMVRDDARSLAIINTIHAIDRSVQRKRPDISEGAFYLDSSFERAENGEELETKSTVDLILKNAREFINSEVPSVIQKTTLPPSGRIRDYWHPAPYWWPNPNKPDGKPYVRIDGKRVPGTLLFSDGCEKYDRTSLQKMFDQTTTLALAWRITGNYEFLEACLNRIETWFLKPKSRMNPHLRFAQVISGRNGDRGRGPGVIEFKDVYFFLDAIQCLRASTLAAAATLDGLMDWFREYDQWLENSNQGKFGLEADNNHFTYYALQRSAINAFLGNSDKVSQILRDAVDKIPKQFSVDGVQTEEIKRVDSRSYSSFNLLGWMNLALLAKGFGEPFGPWNEEPFVRIANAVNMFATHDSKSWPYGQSAEFDEAQFQPMVRIAKSLGIPLEEEISVYHNNPDTNPLFHPFVGVFPYWNLSIS